MTTTDLLNAFVSSGLDTPEKVAAFLKPSAIAAQLADYDGQIAAFQKESSALVIEREAKLKDLIANRELAREKLQS